MRSTSTASGRDLLDLCIHVGCGQRASGDSRVGDVDERTGRRPLRPEHDDRLVGDDEGVATGRPFDRLDRPRHLGRVGEVVPVQAPLLLVDPRSRRRARARLRQQPAGPDVARRSRARGSALLRWHTRPRAAPGGDRVSGRTRTRNPAAAGHEGPQRPGAGAHDWLRDEREEAERHEPAERGPRSSEKVAELVDVPREAFRELSHRVWSVTTWRQMSPSAPASARRRRRCRESGAGECAGKKPSRGSRRQARARRTGRRTGPRGASSAPPARGRPRRRRPMAAGLRSGRATGDERE